MNVEELIRLCDFPNPPTNESAIIALQEVLDLRFPEQFNQYLLQQNGGFFRCVSIKTPWHPEPGRDQLESIYHVDVDRVMESWKALDKMIEEDLESLPGNWDQYELDDAIGCVQSVFLLQDEKPIDCLPIARTGLGHIVYMIFDNGDFDCIAIKGAFIAEPKFYCDSFDRFLDQLSEDKN